MISITRKKWDEIPELKDKDLSSDLLNTINLIYNNIESEYRYAYVLELNFGDFVIHNGAININKSDLSGHVTNEFLRDISYSVDPLALVIQNQIDVYTINRCDNRKRIIKEKDGKNENSIEDREYPVPLNTITKGDFFGVFGTLDYFSNNKVPTDHGMDWFAVSGLSTFVFDFPFFYSTVNVKEDYAKLFKQYYDKANSTYYPGKEQIDLFRNLLPWYKTRVIYFPEHIFKIDNILLREKLHYHLLIKGWAQYSPLRNTSFENKVLSDILKNISLNNETDFILKLYDYLRNVFSGNAKILRPLKPNENHFLNDAIEVFKSNCSDYFNETKKHILPLCYIYNKSKTVEIGILSMTNLPILKNYRYTNLKDVMDDLSTINDEFKEEKLEEYILDLNKLKGYGGVDHSRINTSKINGTAEFRKLISSLFEIEESKILPTSGQFKNAIAIALK